MREPYHGEFLCSGGITWQYSSEESRGLGLSLKRQIMSSPILMNRWGGEGIIDIDVPYNRALDGYNPKGQYDIEVIVAADNNGARAETENVLDMFDINICRSAYYLSEGFVIPNPWASLWGRTNVNRNRGGLVVNYMIALKSNSALSYDDAMSKFEVKFTQRTMAIIEKEFSSSRGGFFASHFDQFQDRIRCDFKSQYEIKDDEYIACYKEVDKIRRSIITESLRIACTNTPGNDAAALNSAMYDPIKTHNLMYIKQIIRYMKYGYRGIIFPELPSDFVLSIHCREIYRSLPSANRVLYDSDSYYSSDDDMSDDSSDSIEDNSDNEFTNQYRIDNWISNWR